MQLKFLNFILLCLILSFVEAVDRSERIVNGTDATIEEFSFMVSLRTRIGHNCAATILNEWWVLTGAICLVNEPVANVSVLHSSTYLRSTGPNIIQAEKYIIHEGFDASNSWIHDIAVVKLKSPMQISLFDYKVKLALKGSVYTSGMTSVFSGWGRNSTSAPLMTRLQKVTFKLYSAKDCNNVMPIKVHPTQICAGPIDGNSRFNNKIFVYARDAGGALLVNGVHIAASTWMMSDCLTSPYLTVFTQIGPYLDWIKEKTGADPSLNMFLTG